MHKVTILGSTGSIGRQTLDVIREHKDAFRVVGLGARGSNPELLFKQALEFDVQTVAVWEQEAASFLKERLQGRRILRGRGGLMELAGVGEADTVLCAMVGMEGLYSALEAARTGARLALANKEALVAGGDLLLEACRRWGSELVPVDSEHSAIYQCLLGQARPVRRIILTASGGPFRDHPAEALEGVTSKEALCHPNWNMGAKISVDSATLANKGLEVIEAHYLFQIPYDSIEVSVHRQSIVHSMVEFQDGSLLAHLGPADMRIPIAYALSAPERLALSVNYLDLSRMGQLTFEEVRWDDFPALRLAYGAGRVGGSMTAVYNAANEVAVTAFLAGRIKFTHIAQVIEAVMEHHDVVSFETLEVLTACDEWARSRAEEEAGRLSRV